MVGIGHTFLFWRKFFWEALYYLRFEIRCRYCHSKKFVLSIEGIPTLGVKGYWAMGFYVYCIPVPRFSRPYRVLSCLGCKIFHCNWPYGRGKNRLNILRLVFLCPTIVVPRLPERLFLPKPRHSIAFQRCPIWRLGPTNFPWALIRGYGRWRWPRPH